ncbi:YutD family protein [Streptococcus halichoeri]|uniref:YutD family protein n=1 Tax=Streptococcus halichoeri TaxID=254785 RepID=UPI0013579BA5|nr:YutD family protein [Streptococcus halichoeri]
MKKEISEDMFNYNKFPGPDFVLIDQLVKSGDIEFHLVENVKNAFDTKHFGQRYTDFLLKYDYLVGDWGNEQLRIRGFYKDQDNIRRASRISRLEDYIKEFCNFGCAYFVLENPNPKEVTYEEERPMRRKRTSRGRGAKGSTNASRTGASNKAKKAKRQKKESGKTDKGVTFTSKQRTPKNRPKSASPEAKPEKMAKTKNSHFIIRKKDK